MEDMDAHSEDEVLVAVVVHSSEEADVHRNRRVDREEAQVHCIAVVAGRDVWVASGRREALDEYQVDNSCEDRSKEVHGDYHRADNAEVEEVLAVAAAAAGVVPSDSAVDQPDAVAADVANSVDWHTCVKEENDSSRPEACVSVD